MSDLYIQINYAKIVGRTLDRFKIKKESPLHINSRCPICGDSSKSNSLCRFHIREHDSNIFVSCFNCGYSTHLAGFLKTYHPSIYQEYIFERYKSGPKDTPVITTKIETIKTAPAALSSLDICYIKDLPETHPARSYVASRHLPAYPFMYAERFYEFASKYNPDLVKTERDEPRLIIPFFDRKGNIFAFQGRDLSGVSSLKYVTIRINKKIPNIFGLDRCNFKEPLIIVEGPLDSLFLRNSVAAVNSGLVATAEKLLPVINKHLITLVFDAEPRNREICKMYQDAITKGYKIVIWPLNQGDKVDINDLILRGKDPQKIIDSHTYQGLTAQILFDQWKKI